MSLKKKGGEGRIWQTLYSSKKPKKGPSHPQKEYPLDESQTAQHRKSKGGCRTKQPGKKKRERIYVERKEVKGNQRPGKEMRSYSIRVAGLKSDANNCMGRNSQNSTEKVQRGQKKTENQKQRIRNAWWAFFVGQRARGGNKTACIQRSEGARLLRGKTGTQKRMGTHIIGDLT